MLSLFKSTGKNDENNSPKITPKGKLILAIIILLTILSILIYICCRQRQRSNESSVLSLDRSLNTNTNSDIADQRATITLTEDLLRLRKDGEFYADEETEESDMESESEDFRLKMGENLTSSNTHSVNSNDIRDGVRSVKSDVENFHPKGNLEDDFLSAKERNMTPPKKRTSNMGPKNFKKTKTQNEFE